MFSNGEGAQNSLSFRRGGTMRIALRTRGTNSSIEVSSTYFGADERTNHRRTQKCAWCQKRTTNWHETNFKKLEDMS